jgi:tape measure domain-containing protein
MSGTVDIGRLLVRIEANQAQLRSAMADAKKQVESFASTSKSSVSGFEAAWDKAGAGIARAGLQALATVASFQAAASAIGDTIKRADEAAAAQARLGTAIGSMARGREIFDQLSRSAQQTGTSATDAAGAFARLSVAARQVGATNQQTLQLVTTMQRLAIISGSSTQEAAASMQQFGQALASGKLQGDELRSLLENMPTLVEKLAGQLGVSVATLRQMGTEGKLTSDVVLPAMLRIAGDVNEQFARMPMTVSRATDSLSQAWSNLVVQVDRATGGSQALANVIKSASDQVQRMADRWVPPSALEQLQTARAEFERIAEAQRRIDERGRGTIQPEMTAQRRGGINTGLQRAAAAQTPTATREELAVREEEIQQLERLARADADVAAALSALEVDTAAAAAAEAARQRVLEQLKEATESFGGANDKQRDQMQALRTVIAEGDGALAKYGITAQVAASMLAAFEARVDSVRGAIASLDAQITQNAASASFAALN